MTRRAILLASVLNGDAIFGFHRKIEAFDRFLRSHVGGAWTDDEIIGVMNATGKEIVSIISAARNVDYSLVFFAGEGEIVKMGLPWAEMCAVLAPGLTITERGLNTGSPRCTLIFDCDQLPLKQGNETSIDDDAMRVETGRDFHMLYDKSLIAAEAGLVTIYATRMDFGMSDASSFTEQLLRQAVVWGERNTGILTLDQAVALAVSAMEPKNPQQRPQYHGGRRLKHFPFAVNL